MDLQKTPLMDEFAVLVAKYGDSIKKVKVTLKPGLTTDLYPPGTSQVDVMAPDYCPNCDELKRWNKQIRKKYDLFLADRDALVAERKEMKAQLAMICICGWYKDGCGYPYGPCSEENRKLMRCPVQGARGRDEKPEDLVDVLTPRSAPGT